MDRYTSPFIERLHNQNLPVLAVSPTHENAHHSRLAGAEPELNAWEAFVIPFHFTPDS
ncbi:hypothetical protein [Candidatus Leptofilum sp.]|uniref:hypothetical protein n=1 Tax=Candidatus Leptofilum sp. TaxID=3241576 RepID=UPI003B59ABD1